MPVAFVGVMDDWLWLRQIMPYELCFVHGFRYFCIFVCKDSLSVEINQEFMVRRACIYLLLLLVIAIATSCRDDGRAEGLLRTVDSLMEERPDSSLALLSRDSAVFARSGKAVRMAYTLSKTEAEDKCYIPHRSDSVILPRGRILRRTRHPVTTSALAIYSRACVLRPPSVRPRPYSL